MKISDLLERLSFASHKPICPSTHGLPSWAPGSAVINVGYVQCGACGEEVKIGLLSVPSWIVGSERQNEVNRKAICWGVHRRKLDVWMNRSPLLFWRSKPKPPKFADPAGLWEYHV